RILIIEDAPEVRLLVRGVLESEHYEVHTAEDGAAALRCLANHPVDLLLLDIDLPDIQGTTLCRDLREQGCRLPIVMLTCHNQGNERAAGLDCGADDYLGKPFVPEELLARIRAHLRREERFSKSVEELVKDRWERINEGMRLAQKMGRPPRLDCIASAAQHVPIGHIGGDFYVLEQIDEDRWVVVIADTMGKGLGAAMIMSWTLAAVHQLVQEGLSPADLVNRLNAEIGPDLEEMSVFVALFCGMYDRRTGEFKFCSAGSEPPLWLPRARSGRRHRRLSTEGMPVGVMTEFTYLESSIHPLPGDRLFLFTDGLTDSVPFEDGPLLLRKLYRALLASADQPVGQQAQGLMQCLRDLGGDDLMLKDDLTYLLLEF
ncbi:unnamed protein product, partial [Phaeothamnion confervicola]